MALQKDVLNWRISMREADGPFGVHHSGPEWLHFCEDAIGTHCVPEHGRSACLLAARKAAGGKRLLGAASASLVAGRLLVDDPLRQRLMDRNVIQVAERILQLCQCRNQILPPSHRSL